MSPQNPRLIYGPRDVEDGLKRFASSFDGWCPNPHVGVFHRRLVPLEAGREHSGAKRAVIGLQHDRSFLVMLRVGPKPDDAPSIRDWRILVLDRRITYQGIAVRVLVADAFPQGDVVHGIFDQTFPLITIRGMLVETTSG